MDSAFGNFPCTHKPKKSSVVAKPDVLNAAEASIAAGHTAKGKSNNQSKYLLAKNLTLITEQFITVLATLKRGQGSGGNPSSLNKPAEKPKPIAPKAGAVKKRPIQPSEFRRFYDRGDLPI